MLPLADLIAVARTTDARGRSPVADAAVAPWGVGAGEAQFWRSSASHVFRLAAVDGVREAMFVRCDALSLVRDGPALRTAHHAALMAAEADVAPLVRSQAGRWSERVNTVVGPLVVSVVAAVPGEELEVEDLLSGPRSRAARAWGAALAAWHRSGVRAGLVDPRAGAAAPTALSRLVDVSDQPELRSAAAVLSAVPAQALGAWVLGHGDFELDNLRWQGDRVTAFDLGETAVMPASLDVAAAVRDLVGDDPGRPSHPDQLAAFLDGYRAAGGQPLPSEGLLVGAGEVAARWLLISSNVLRLPGPDASSPTLDWVPQLRRDLVAHGARMASILVRAAGALGSD